MVAAEGRLQGARVSGAAGARLDPSSAGQHQGGPAEMLNAVLDDVQRELARPQPLVGETLDRLHRELLGWRMQHSQLWDDVRRGVRGHPLTRLLDQDPLTRRCYQKPRGYPGDAVLLDYIYDGRSGGSVSELGAAILAHHVETTGCRSVRLRRDLVTEAVDRAAAARDGASILSVACGHLREFPRSEARAAGAISRWVALDQDPLSIETLRRDCGPSDILDARVCAVAELLAEQDRWEGQFDLVYAAGLCDYLPDAAFVRLTRALYGMCRPGGKLLLANVTAENPQLGYHESFMDWMFVLRGEAGLEALARRAVGDDAALRTFRDPTRVICFLELER